MLGCPILLDRLCGIFKKKVFILKYGSYNSFQIISD